ncbi:uncharacterized protein [Dermacentor albipictus]|uniref:uncharacterized protein n=1 Tax=Dermacentor albipictus TaxID=60249 RepID=UPI0038FCBDE8
MQYEQAFPNDSAAYDQPYDPPDYAPTPYGQTPYGQTPYGQTPYGQGDFRQAWSTYHVPVESKEAQPLGGGMWLTTALLCATILLLIGITVTILVATAGFAHVPSTTETDFVFTGGSPPPGPVDRVAMAELPKARTRTPPVTTEPTAKPPIKEFTPKMVKDKEPMVCTMGDRLISKLQFPPDRLCDFIFFDSLYKGGRNVLTDPSTYSKSLNTFLNDHHDYRLTTLGVGFAFDYLSTVEEDLKARSPSPLAPFWNRGIFHTGIIDTPASTDRSRTRAAIATLKMINQLLDTQRQRGNFSITALALPHPDLDWSSAFDRDFNDLRFTPYLFITFGHYRFGDNMAEHCFVMPPTRHPDDSPPDDIAKDYNFDLSTAVFSLRELYTQGTNTRGLVSVTLKGRWTEPMFPDKVDFYTRCLSDRDIEPFGSYTEVCPGGGSPFEARLNYSEKHYAVITTIRPIKRTFVYDDERSFAAKLCNVKALYSSVTFGIAVYDIDYDDHENKCSSLNRRNRNSRLKAVKKVVESFRKQSLHFDENTCRQNVLS